MDDDHTCEKCGRHLTPILSGQFIVGWCGMCKEYQPYSKPLQTD